ncbi:unnamed protein product [Ectocarpus sp. 12 AP-2014]
MTLPPVGELLRCTFGQKQSLQLRPFFPRGFVLLLSSVLAVFTPTGRLQSLWRQELWLRELASPRRRARRQALTTSSDVVLPPGRFARAVYGIDPSPASARLLTFVGCDGDTTDKLSLRLALSGWIAVKLYTVVVKMVPRFKPRGLYVATSYTLVYLRTSVAGTFVVYNDR